MVELRMDPLSWLRKTLETADVDLLREMVRSFAKTLVSALAKTLDAEVPAFRSRPPLSPPMATGRSWGSISSRLKTERLGLSSCGVLWPGDSLECVWSFPMTCNSKVNVDGLRSLGLL